MFYEPEKNNHGLPHNPYKACVVPRPIGWITTLNATGRVNLAPFSQFNNLGYDPPYVMFSAAGHEFEHRLKDTVANVEATGEFVYNMATYELRNAVNLSGQIIDSEVDEMAAAGLTPASSRLVKPPRVSQSPIQFECHHRQTIILPGRSWSTTNHVVIGQVVGVHIADQVIGADGKVDVARIRPIARLGYMEYTSVEHVFEMGIIDPSMKEKLTIAMSGGMASGPREQP